MRGSYLWILPAAALLAGCGTTKGTGEVAGVITDGNGNPVRNATVYYGVLGRDRQTVSNSEGIYLLTGVPEANQVIRATVTKDGVRYYGQNVAQVFAGDRTKNVNIAVVRDTQLASIRGFVSDRSGNRIGGAKVLAFGNALTSSMAITNRDGEYVIGGLWSGVDYSVTASARTYNSDTEFVGLNAGEERFLNFVLGDGTNASLPAPTGLVAVIWTSPRETTRSRTEREAMIAIRRMLKPSFHPSASSTRLSNGGNWIQTDLAWDPVFHEAMLGYGIYRGTSPGGNLPAIDFLRETESAYYSDHDDRLVQNLTYYYEVTALNTQYPDFANSESPPSNRVGVTAIGDLFLNAVSFSPLRFNWQPADGAESYSVFLFDTYPSIGVTSIWNTDGSRTTGTSQTYTGGGLVPGARYYYIVVGWANGDTSVSISPVESFIAP